MSIFSVILDSELRKRGLSMRQVAREIGVSHTTLYAARNGARSMDLETALAICRWLGVPLSVLVGEAGPDQNPVAQAVARVLASSPELERALVAAAELPLPDFAEVVEFAAWKVWRAGK